MGSLGQMIQTLLTAAGWQAISILKFCNFCLRTRNHWWKEILLCSRPACIQASKSSSNFSVCENCALCFTSSLTLQMKKKNLGIPTVYVQLEFVIMYDIILDFSDITHESLWYVLWYHRTMISHNLDIIDAGPWYHVWYHAWYQYGYQRYRLWYHRAMISYNLDIIDAGPWYHV